MGPSPIQPVIQPVTINTMLNNNGLNIGNGLNFITCGQTSTPYAKENTLRFAYEFGCNEVRAVKSRFLWTQVIDSNVKEFGYSSNSLK